MVFNSLFCCGDEPSQSESEKKKCTSVNTHANFMSSGVLIIKASLYGKSTILT